MCVQYRNDAIFVWYEYLVSNCNVLWNAFQFEISCFCFLLVTALTGIQYMCVHVVKRFTSIAVMPDPPARLTASEQEPWRLTLKWDRPRGASRSDYLLYRFNVTQVSDTGAGSLVRPYLTRSRPALEADVTAPIPLHLAHLLRWTPSDLHIVHVEF